MIMVSFRALMSIPTLVADQQVVLTLDLLQTLITLGRVYLRMVPRGHRLDIGDITLSNAHCDKVVSFSPS